MDEHDRHKALDYGHLAMHIAAIFFVIFVGVFVIWLVASKPNSKLFQDDNVICYSQPFAMDCQPKSH